MEGIYLVKAANPDRDNRDAKANGHHTDAGTECMDLAIGRAKAFRKNNRTVTAIDEVSCVRERAARARHLLRQWVGVVNRAGEKIVQRRGGDFFQRMT